MNENLAYQEEPWEEKLNGEIILMSPLPTVNHNWVAGRIFVAFSVCLKGKSCIPFGDGTDVYLTESDHVIPDVMIICNRDIIQNDGIHGTLDLIVEVLSSSTTKNDRGYKKDLYERVGVKEYWIADPKLCSIEVYLLENGKYKLDEVYALPIDDMKEEEKAKCKVSAPVSLYDNFTIPLEEIFYNLL